MLITAMFVVPCQKYAIMCCLVSVTFFFFKTFMCFHDVFPVIQKMLPAWILLTSSFLLSVVFHSVLLPYCLKFEVVIVGNQSYYKCPPGTGPVINPVCTAPVVMIVSSSQVW